METAKGFLGEALQHTTMKKQIHSQSAFLYLRVSAGLLLVLTGVFLGLMGLGRLSAEGDEGNEMAAAVAYLVPPGFDCNQLHSLGLDKQENFRAGAINIFCGAPSGSSQDADAGAPVQSIIQQVLAPLYGGSDVDVVTGPDNPPHITQSESFSAANPDNPNEIVVAFNDSRGAAVGNFSAASVSSDGGQTFTRLTTASGQSPFTNTFGDPVVLYNRPSATWFTVWLDGGCGGQGVGGYKSTTPSDPTSWTHFCVHNNSGDDRESGWADNNPSSPHYGRMYVSFNDFNRGSGALFVRYSDNGSTWTETQITTGFFRDVQITGDAATGDVYLAAMNEFGGGLGNRANLFYKSTNGGQNFTQIYTGPTFAGPGTTTCASQSYFACMFNSPSFWRHMGWGQPAVLNGVVSYVYDARNTSNGDSADVYYIRSADGGNTFSAPMKLNTDTTTRPQWQPNLSVGPDGSLLAVWYDARESTNCVKGNTSVPCYRMWARKSTDNGATWQPDAPFSDTISPLPDQPDFNIVTEYAGDYDYSFASPAGHIHTWTDGRVAIGGNSQQDVFEDQEPISGGGGGPTLTAAGSRRQHGPEGAFTIKMPLTGTVGVEDRNGHGRFLAVFSFDSAVTSANVTVTGNATAGTPQFSGSQMLVPLSNVADQQIVTFHIGNVNGSSGSVDVSFGFLIGDVNGDHVVNRPDATRVNSARGQTVDATNFRDDIDLSGFVDLPDRTTVIARRGNSIPQ